MSNRAHRAGMLSGVAFPILLFVGASMIFGKAPDTSNSTADQVAQKYLVVIGDKGDRVSIIIGGFVMVVAALALIWFASTIRGRYASGGGNPMVAFATLAATGIAFAAIGPLAVVGGHTFGGDPLPNEGNAVLLVFNQLFPMLLVVFGIASSAFIAAVLVATKGNFPTWLVAFGWVAVVGGAAGVLFLPMGIVLLWYLAFAIMALRRGPTDEPTA